MYVGVGAKLCSIYLYFKIFHYILIIRRCRC